jgi:hypothetical protein
MAIYNSDGCVGRCDANCHDATTPICTCICGGRNHGVGLKQAIDNTALHFKQEDLEQLAQAGGYKKIEVTAQAELDL